MFRNKGGRGCCLSRIGCCLLAVVMLLCVLPMGLAYYAVSGGPEPIDPNFKATQADADLYEKAYQIALRNASTSGRIVLTIPDEEFASWLTLNFRQEIADQLGLSELADQMTFQVKFDNNEAQVFMQLDAGVGKINSLSVMTITPPKPNTPAGQPLDIQVKSLELGRFDGSDQFAPDLSTAINDALTAQLAAIEGRYTIDSVTLDNGKLGFGGKVTPKRP